MSTLSSSYTTATPRDSAAERNVARRWVASPWFWFCVADLIVSYFILRWARTSPGYDPYGWLTWGYQTLHGSLDLKGAPSWKPITYVFTLPYSLAGTRSWWLWRVTSLAFSIGGLVAGGRLAYRLVRREDEKPWAAWIAGLFAFVGLAMIIQYWHYILSSQSDSMLVAFVLIALNQQLSGNKGWAIFYLVCAGLGRPEAWIILGPLGVWAFLTEPRLRWILLAELAAMIFLWFIVPVLSGAPWDIAQKLAQHSVRELHSDKLFGTIRRFIDLSQWPVMVTAAATVVWAVLRRDYRVILLAAVPILWMLVEIWFVLSNGFPGVPRYMFEAAATTIVLAGVGIGWLARIALGSSRAPLAAEPGYGVAVARPRLRLSGSGTATAIQVDGVGRTPERAASEVASNADSAGESAPSEGSTVLPRLVAGAIVLVMIGFMVPYAKSSWDFEHKDIRAERERSHSIYMLRQAIKVAGGANFVKSCGTPTIDVGTASILAWDTHTSTAHIGYIPKRQIASKKPTVLFTGLFNGFTIHTYNLTAAQKSPCAKLNDAYYLVTAGHPDGEFIHLNH